MHESDDDKSLLAAVERVLSLTHGPPDHVLEAGHAAFDWPAVDAELAKIVDESTAMSLRGAGDALQLRFELGDFALELEVLTTTDSQQVIGWLQEAAVVPFEVHHSGGTLAARTDADGRFFLESLGRGAARIIVRRPEREPVEVRWASR